MRAYSLEFLPQAHRDLFMLDREVARRILNKLDWLAEHFEELTPIQLTGTMRGFNRLRIGAYRAIYSIDNQEQVITVHRIAHRREAY